MAPADLLIRAEQIALGVIQQNDAARPQIAHAAAQLRPYRAGRACDQVHPAFDTMPNSLFVQGDRFPPEELPQHVFIV
jgi:hypothetical protein